MTDQTYSAPADAVARRQTVRSGLKRRHLGERLFRTFGIVAIVLALGFVAILFADVLRKGIPAFTQSNIQLAVTFDPEVIDVGPSPVQAAGQSDAVFRAERLAWERQVAMLVRRSGAYGPLQFAHDAQGRPRVAHASVLAAS